LPIRERPTPKRGMSPNGEHTLLGNRPALRTEESRDLRRRKTVTKTSEDCVNGEDARRHTALHPPTKARKKSGGSCFQAPTTCSTTEKEVRKGPFTGRGTPEFAGATAPEQRKKTRALRSSRFKKTGGGFAVKREASTVSRKRTVVGEEGTGRRRQGVSFTLFSCEGPRFMQLKQKNRIDRRENS